MTNGSKNDGIIKWRTSYEDFLGYLTMFKKIVYECGEEKMIFHWKKWEKRICVPLRDM